MKNWLLVLLTLGITACGNGGGGGGNSTPTPTATPTVTTPLTSCLDGSTYCNNQVYSTIPGFMPYPGMYTYAYDYRAYFNQYGFCNCPLYTTPVYNPAYGLGCMQTRYLTSGYSGGSYMYWQFQMSSSWSSGWYSSNDYWYYSSAPTMPNNFPQSSNIPNGYYGNSGGSCPRNLTQTCVVNQANSCGAGATCRQVVAGSTLGVCANY